MRKEKDFIGEVELPANSLFGIQSYRACANFPKSELFNISWYKSMGLVKRACYTTIKAFFSELKKKYPGKKFYFNTMSDKTLDVLIEAAKEIENGEYFDQFIVPAISGGAGTSINMNINEIIANVALTKLGHCIGDYDKIDPIEQANLFQSTNDVVPTALKVAVMNQLTNLELAINSTRAGVEELEQKYSNTLRVGYTQMQAAVPTTYGRFFASYSDAFSRDWWRVSKCFERIKVVNLGGSAVGTGLTLPRFYVMKVASYLQQLTGMPITRGENLSDATSNLDSFVEVHAILKAHAVNLEKMSSDLRLLASDVVGEPEISLPNKQIGSTIMPSKVNPVISEYVVSIAHQIYANDQLITSLCAQGCLDLNAYIPIIGHRLLESIELMVSANKTLKDNLLSGLRIRENVSESKLYNNPSTATAMLPHLGYHNAAKLTLAMKQEKYDIFAANKNTIGIPDEVLREILSTEKLIAEGFIIKDLMGHEEGKGE